MDRTFGIEDFEEDVLDACFQFGWTPSVIKEYLDDPKTTRDNLLKLVDANASNKYGERQLLIPLYYLLIEMHQVNLNTYALAGGKEPNRPKLVSFKDFTSNDINERIIRPQPRKRETTMFKKMVAQQSNKQRELF